MKNILIRLFASRIPNRAKRHYFRNKWNGRASIELAGDQLFVAGPKIALDQTIENPAISPFSIAIVTYNQRFGKFFVPLLRQIREHFDGEIIVGINGNHGQKFDEEYRVKMLQLLAKYEGVFPIFFPTFRGLPKIWNSCPIPTFFFSMTMWRFGGFFGRIWRRRSHK